jgi:hypothetical protein
MRTPIVCAALAGLAFVSCWPLPAPDTRPPVLIDAQVSDDGSAVALTFDEPVASVRAGGDVAPSPAPAVAGPKVTVALARDLKPGRPYQWSAEVADPGNNETSLAGRFYGPNGHPAALRLNEVRIAGSGDHPDFVELRAEAGGNLGGWTLEVRSSASSATKLVLPDQTVEPGDLVVVWTKAPPPGEAGTPSYLLAGAKGLPGTKGTVVLRPAPGKEPVDGLAWAAKPGEGEALARASGWTAPGELDPAGCTSTRTWSRTDEGGGWILTATGGATPGRPNKAIPWAGPPASRPATPKTKG